MKTLAYLTFIFSLSNALAQEAGDTNKATPPAKTGTGDAVYQVVRGWPSYPEGKKMGSLHGDIATDSKGNVYLATGESIHVFDAAGNFIKDLGKETRGVHGIKVRKQGEEEFLFIAQNGLKRVAKLKLDGTKAACSARVGTGQAAG